MSAPKPFVIDPELVTGVGDTGDLLENLLDELKALLNAADSLTSGNADDPMTDLIAAAYRKAMATGRVYEKILEVWQAKGRVTEKCPCCGKAFEEKEAAE